MKNLFLIIILMMMVSLLSAEVKTVTSIGFGENQEKALDNALREGLTKVVGMYMSSSSFVKNYQTINDEITSFSNGYIENYNVTSTSKKDGLIEVQVKMHVKTGTLITKLKELNIATISVLINADNVKKDLKVQNIVKVNQEKLAEEYCKQIIEPIKLNKSHFIKINNFKVYEITDLNGATVNLKGLEDEEVAKFNMSGPPDGDAKYELMDGWYVIKVNYQFGITDKYYNNCVSFMNAAFQNKVENIQISDLDKDSKIIVGKISNLMKTGTADNAYKLDGRTLYKIKKYIEKNNKYTSYELKYDFTAYDKSGFPFIKFKDRLYSPINKNRDIMGFELVTDKRKLQIPYHYDDGILYSKDSNNEWGYRVKHNLCYGILSRYFAEVTKARFDFNGNELYIYKDDYGINFNVYLAVPKTQITEIVEIKAELITK